MSHSDDDGLDDMLDDDLIEEIPDASRPPGRGRRRLTITAAALVALLISTFIAAQVADSLGSKPDGHAGTIAMPAQPGESSAQGDPGTPPSESASASAPAAGPSAGPSALASPPFPYLSQGPGINHPATTGNGLGGLSASPGGQASSKPSSPPAPPQTGAAPTTASPAARPPSTTASPTGPPVPGTVNLAARRPVNAAGYLQNYFPTNVVDENTDTYWEAQPGFPQDLTIDLGAVHAVGRIELYLPNQSNWNSRDETIQILGSTTNPAGADSTIVGSRVYHFDANDPNNRDHVSVSFAPAQARWITLRFTANSGWPDAQLSEIQIY